MKRTAMNAIRPGLTQMAISDDRKNLMTAFISELRDRIHSLRTHFYQIESEFNSGFQSLEQPPTHHGFAELGLLSQLLARYMQCREEAGMMAGLKLQSSDSPQSHATKFQRVSALLADLERHEGDENADDCHAVWQQTSAAFLNLIDSETASVEAAASSMPV